MKQYIPKLFDESIESRRHIDVLSAIIIESLIGMVQKTRRMELPLDYNIFKKYYNKFGKGAILSDFLDEFMGMPIRLVVKSNDDHTYASYITYAEGKGEAIELYLTIDEKKQLNEWTDTGNKTAIWMFFQDKHTAILHELTHAFDDWRSKGKAIKMPKNVANASDEDEAIAYLNSKHEIDARFAQTIKDLEATKIKDTWHTYRNKFFKSFRGWAILDRDMQLPLIKKLRQEYDDLIEKDKNVLIGKALEKVIWGIALGEKPSYKVNKDSRIMNYNLKKEALIFFKELSKGKIPVSEFLDSKGSIYSEIFTSLRSILRGIPKNDGTIEIFKKEYKLSDKDIENIYKKYYKPWGDFLSEKRSTMKHGRYEPLEEYIMDVGEVLDESGELLEAFIIGSKPDHEGGKYVVKKAMGRDPQNPKKFVRGWTKVKKAGVNIKPKGGMSKAQRKVAAKKAARTKKANPAAQKKAQKKAAITRKKNVGNR